MNKKAEQILKAVNQSRVRKRLNRELNGVHHTATVDARLQPFLVPWWVTGTPHTLAYSDGLDRELWIHWAHSTLPAQARKQGQTGQVMAGAM